MKSNRLTRKLPYLIILSVLLFVVTGCNNISQPESSQKTSDAETTNEQSNPVFRTLAANIDE